MMQKATNIVWHGGKVKPGDRTKLTRVRPAVLWLTGLSGCGKSTIAMALEAALVEQGHAAYVLDGDNIRHGLNKDLGFGDADRTENIRRIGEVAKLMVDAGVLTIASFISPFRADRDGVRKLIGDGDFIEVFVDAPIEVCESRDPKGLYKKARAAIEAGKGLAFTGIDSPYEKPEKPEVHLRTGERSVESCVEELIAHLSATRRLL